VLCCYVSLPSGTSPARLAWSIVRRFVGFGFTLSVGFLTRLSKSTTFVFFISTWEFPERLSEFSPHTHSGFHLRNCPLDPRHTIHETFSAPKIHLRLGVHDILQWTSILLSARGSSSGNRKTATCSLTRI